MSKRKRTRHSSREQEPIKVHCNCHCPYWGKEHDQVYVVRCDCGNHENACGHCLQAGRVKECLRCYKERLRTGAGDN